MNFQIGTVLVLISLISISSGYKEDPKTYEEDSVKHIDYEQDQMPIKVPSVKSKRMAVYSQEPNEYEHEGIYHALNENEQTPAQDRAWQVRPKVKRMSSSAKNGKTVHIYLNKDKNGKGAKNVKKSTTTTTTSTTTHDPRKVEVETQTYKTPELTTRADHARQVDYVDRRPKDSVPSESYYSKQTAAPVTDSHTEGSELQEIIKEKIKIKHHHHHHHHNHVKTVVKKEPYRVEVPVEKVKNFARDENLKINFISLFIRLLRRLCLTRK